METPRVANAPAGFGGPPTPSRPAAPTLPPDLLREGVRRLRWVGALTIGVNLFFIALGMLAALDIPAMVRSVGLAANLLGLALGGLVVLLASNPRLDPRMGSRLRARVRGPGRTPHMRSPTRACR